jgi:hypothetical protein
MEKEILGIFSQCLNGERTGIKISKSSTPFQKGIIEYKANMDKVKQGIITIQTPKQNIVVPLLLFSAVK